MFRGMLVCLVLFAGCAAEAVIATDTVMIPEGVVMWSDEVSNPIDPPGCPTSCDDGNWYTADVCTYPSAACAHMPAQPYHKACTQHSDCPKGIIAETESCGYYSGSAIHSYLFYTGECDVQYGYCSMTANGGGEACDDGNACTTDVCDETGTKCDHPPLEVTEVYPDLPYYDIAECDQKDGWKFTLGELYASKDPSVLIQENPFPEYGSPMLIATIEVLQQTDTGEWVYKKIHGNEFEDPIAYAGVKTLNNVCPAYSAAASDSVVGAPVRFYADLCYMKDGTFTLCSGGGTGSGMTAWIGDMNGAKKVLLNLTPIPDFVGPTAKPYYSPDLEAFCKKGLGID